MFYASKPIATFRLAGRLSWWNCFRAAADYSRHSVELIPLEVGRLIAPVRGYA